MLPIGLAVGCQRKSAPAPVASASASVPSGLARGDHVVVESNAAEFFEARILELENAEARVQLVPGGETKLVAIADVYSLATASAKSKVGDYAICNFGARWDACKVVDTHSPTWSVVDTFGVAARVEPRSVLAPTPVTQLNLVRRFERAKDRAEFEHGLASAGAPVAPKGWKPAPSERVLVELEGGWYSGSVYELGKKELRIEWQGGKRVSEVARERVRPMPPYPGVFRHGDYALARPLSLAEAWQAVRVENVDASAISVRDAAGSRKTSSPTELVPLGR